MMLLMLAMSHYDDDKSGISSQMQNLHLSYSKFFSKKRFGQIAIVHQIFEFCEMI